MKMKLIIYLLFGLCVAQVFSQELRLMPKTLDEITIPTMDFNFEEPLEANALSVFQLGRDVYNLHLFSYALDRFSFGINSRLEEELPYENNAYDYTGFYYLDVSLNYVMDNLSLGISIENFLNLNNDSFSIDPIIDTSNGIVNQYYFSHETDALLSMTITYTF